MVAILPSVWRLSGAYVYRECTLHQARQWLLRTFGQRFLRYRSQAVSVIQARVQDWYDRVIDFRHVKDLASRSRTAAAEAFLYEGPGPEFTFSDESDRRLLLNPENHPDPTQCVVPHGGIATCKPLVGVESFLLWNDKWPSANVIKGNLTDNWLRLPAAPLMLTRHKSTIEDIKIDTAPSEMTPRQKSEWGDFIATWTVRVSMDICGTPIPLPRGTLPDQHVTIQAGFKGPALRLLRYVVKSHRLI
jgi:hypothetical protein